MVRHAGVVHAGACVFDLAAGRGRHTLFLARRGARVVAFDRNRAALAALCHAAAGLAVLPVALDLETAQLPTGRADLTLVVRYLDRRRFPDFLATVRPGGYFLAETFTVRHRDLGSGPRSPRHLVEPGELPALVAPFEILAAREEFVTKPMRAHVASVLARAPMGR